MPLFYRFRSTDRLLGTYQELEKQSIFFAAPDQLNDPMEGVRDLFWQGDEIVWKNLFRHYLLCLERVYVLLLVGGERGEPITVTDIPVRATLSDFPPGFQQMLDKFFGHAEVVNCIAGIVNANRKVRRDELIFYLHSLQTVAITSIAAVFREDGRLPALEASASGAEDAMKPIPVDFAEFHETLLRAEAAQAGMAEVMFQSVLKANAQSNLILQYNDAIASKKHKKTLSLMFEFPGMYVKAIEKLIFPEWYTACFMSECGNSATWGHYSKDHKGVCLVFESEEHAGKHVLPLKVKGWVGHGPGQQTTKRAFYPVKYSDGIGEVDFFRSIGTLSAPDVIGMWYSNPGRAVSLCAKELMNDETSWRDAYWRNFLRDISQKTNDWAYEKEHRLLLYGMHQNFSEMKDRVLTYEFSSLKGVIFGINTPTDDKLAIMRIIDIKCAEHGRTDFKFYQAFYSPKEKCIGHTELSLIRYAPQKQ